MTIVNRVMHFQIYSLLAMLILSSVRGDFGKLREDAAGVVLSCPSAGEDAAGVHKTIFTKTAEGDWRARVDDPTYAHQIFKHLSGPFFTALRDKTNVIVTLNHHETDYVIRDINDPGALQYALNEEGISLETFGKNMLYHETQGFDCKCGLHSLNNLFQKTWINPDKALEISETQFPNGDKVYDVMYEQLSSRKIYTFGHYPVVIKGALNYQGFDVPQAAYAADFGSTVAAQFNNDPTNTIFGMILQYNKLVGSHWMAIRRIAGVWWDLNSFGSFGRKGYRGPKPCGGSGNWADCREFIHAKLVGGRGVSPGMAYIANCPRPGDITRRFAMRGPIMPNLANWNEFCPASVPNLIHQICFGTLSHLRNEPRYTDVMAECQDCTEALCQGIRDVSDRHNPVGKYHCRRDNHQCEPWEMFGDQPYGSCDTSNNQCPDELPDCQNEPNWEGTLGKCSCGTHIGACNAWRTHSDTNICLLTMPHQCAPCTDGTDGTTNGGSDNCIDGKVCRMNRVIANRECVERVGRSGMYSEYYERSINIVYWLLALDMLCIIGIGCLVMFMLFIGGCFVLYYLEKKY